MSVDETPLPSETMKNTSLSRLFVLIVVRKVWTLSFGSPSERKTYTREQLDDMGTLASSDLLVISNALFIALT